MPSIGRYFKFPGTLLVILTCSTFPTVTLEWWDCIRLCWKSETVRGIALSPTIRPIRILTICSFVPFFLPSATTEKDDFFISKTSFAPCPLNPILICFLKALLSQLSTLLSLLYYFHYYKNYVFMIKIIHRHISCLCFHLICPIEPRLFAPTPITIVESKSQTHYLSQTHRTQLSLILLNLWNHLSVLTSLYLKHDSFLTSLTQYSPDYLTEYVISVPLLAVSRLNIGILQGSVLESFFLSLLKWFHQLQ